LHIFIAGIVFFIVKYNKTDKKIVIQTTCVTAYFERYSYEYCKYRKIIPAQKEKSPF